MRQRLKGAALFFLSALTLSGAVALMYYRYVLPPYWPKLIGAYDFRRFYGPLTYFLDTVLHKGELPFWNPLMYCGNPFAADPQAAVFYPPHLLRSLLTFEVTPLSVLAGLYVMLGLHMVVAGLGTLGVARDYKLSRGAGFVAAFAYVFGPGYVRMAVNNWVLPAVASWLPLAIFFVRRALYAETWTTRLTNSIGGGVTVALGFLAGFPQVSVYLAVSVAFFVLLDRLFHMKFAFVREPRELGRVAFRAGAVLLVVFVLAGLLAAALLIPAAELTSHSARTRSGGYDLAIWEQDFSFKHQFESLIVYPGAAKIEQGVRGAGLLVVLLALVAVTHTRRRDVLVFGMLYVVLTDATLGPPFPVGRLMYALDVFQFSSPWRMSILAGFPLALLAGFGVDAVAARLKTPSRTNFRQVVVIAVGGVFVYCLAEWFRDDPYIEVNASVVAIPAAGLAFVALAAWFRRPVWSVLAPLLVFVEIFAWNYHFIPEFMKEQRWSRPVPSGQDLPLDNHRWPDPRQNMGHYALDLALNGYNPLYIGRVREVLCDPGLSQQYARSIRDWEVTQTNQRGNLFLKRPFWLASQYVDGTLPSKEALFPATTTVFLQGAGDGLPVRKVAGTSVPNRSVSGATERINLLDGKNKVLRRPGRGRQAGSVEIELPTFDLDGTHTALVVSYSSRGPAEIKTMFYSADSDRRIWGMTHRIAATDNARRTLEYPLPALDRVRAVFTCRPLQGKVTVNFHEAYLLRDRADENEHLEIVHRSANSIEVRVKDLSSPRILTYLDSHYPGWKAYLDSKPVPIYLANDAFKAVVVPEGTHTVRFEFRPWRVYAGIATSLATALAILGYLFVVFVIQMRRGSPRPA